jgi:uncharacterized repeat protein (TIGR04138 family)
MLDKDAIILDLAERDARYKPAAYNFVFEALDHTLSMRGGGRRHVSGREIMEGVRTLALERFGFLARTVFRHWGVTRTDDFGEIVFSLSAADLLQKTADDRKEHFCGLYDFETVFDHAFEESLHSAEF